MPGKNPIHDISILTMYDKMFQMPNRINLFAAANNLLDFSTITEESLFSWRRTLLILRIGLTSELTFTVLRKMLSHLHF